MDYLKGKGKKRIETEFLAKTRFLSVQINPLD